MEKLFSKSHEWVKIEGSKAQIGLSDYAQQELGDDRGLADVGLAREGDLGQTVLRELGSDVECGKAFTDIESVKAVSEVLSPVCGKVVAVNEELADAPEKINEASDDAWIVEVEKTVSEDALMTAEQYDEYIKPQ